LRREHEEMSPNEIAPCSKNIKTYWAQHRRLILKAGIIYRKWEGIDKQPTYWQMLLPNRYRELCIELAHKGPVQGHRGIRKTQEEVQKFAYWVGWKGDVEKYILACENCARYMRGNPTRRAPLQKALVGEPLERVALDITGPHPKSKMGNIWILTVLDLFSKWALAFPIKNHEAVTISKLLIEKVFTVYGTPKQLLTDQGKEFESKLMGELCQRFDIEKLRCVSYKPSTNGGCDRTIS